MEMEHRVEQLRQGRERAVPVSCKFDYYVYVQALFELIEVGRGSSILINNGGGVQAQSARLSQTLIGVQIFLVSKVWVA
jgi:hypothetical protein